MEAFQTTKVNINISEFFMHQSYNTIMSILTFNNDHKIIDFSHQISSLIFSI
jgi:hypothetical protein